MVFNNPPKRPMPRPPMQPAPQPVRSPFMGPFGQQIVRAPQPAPQPVRPPFTSAFGQPIARAPQPTQGPMTSLVNSMSPEQRNAIPSRPAGFPAIAPQPMQGPSAFAGMFGNGGFGQPLPPFTSAFGQPIARAPQPTQSPFLGGLGGGQPMPAQQTPQPTTGLSGLGALSPEQITQLQNNMGPQTLPANINQELAKMSPGYSNTGTQNMMGGPGMGFPAVPVQNSGATDMNPPPTGGLSSLGLS